ncbi:hypothetical protein D9M73_199250 [compost metagenome]
MVDDEVAPDHHLARQFDTGDDLDEFEQHLVDERAQFAQQCRAQRIAPAAKAVHQQYPEALGAPVPAMGTQVGANILEHGSTYLVGWLAYRVLNSKDQVARQ